MDDYTEAEKQEFERIRGELAIHMVSVHPLADYYAAVAHFVMRKLREDRGFDFRAAEARRLRDRLAQIDREVMSGD